MLLVDNEAARRGVYNQAMLAELLCELADTSAGLAGTGFDSAALDLMLKDLGTSEASGGQGSGQSLEEDPEPEPSELSDGSLLALANVTIADPVHRVELGQTWQLGDHILVCADVMIQHELWREHLEDGVLFCPYPGPLAPLTLRAQKARLLMVQPDPYIAGHILDRFAEVAQVKPVKL